MNVKEKAQLAVITVKKKVLPVIASASVAMSTVAVNAFAVDETAGGGGGIYSQIADSFGSGVNEMMTGIGLVFTAIVPVMVGIVGVYAALGAGKKIITKLSG